MSGNTIRIRAWLDVPARLSPDVVDEATALFASRVRWSLNRAYRQQQKDNAEVRDQIIAAFRAHHPEFDEAMV